MPISDDPKFREIIAHQILRDKIIKSLVEKASVVIDIINRKKIPANQNSVKLISDDIEFFLENHIPLVRPEDQDIFTPQIIANMAVEITNELLGLQTTNLAEIYFALFDAVSARLPANPAGQEPPQVQTAPPPQAG